MSNSVPPGARGRAVRRGPRHARARTSKRPFVAASLALSGLCALLAYIAVGPGGGVAQAGTPAPKPSASGTMTVHVKQSSITDATCEGGGTVRTGVYLVLNQIAKADAPLTVHVFFDPTGGADAKRVVNNQNESAYSVSFPAGVTGITDATAVVPTNWSGQFVVSHYLCGSQSTTPSTPETTPVTTTPSTPETTTVTTTESSSASVSSSSVPGSSAATSTSPAFVPGPGQTGDSQPGGGSPLRAVLLGVALALLGSALAVWVQPYLRRRGNHA